MVNLGRTLVVLGTRPEAIKLAPVILELHRNWGPRRCIVCSTGQHREMLDQTLQTFGIVPDIELNAMRPGQSLAALTGRLFQGLDGVLEGEGPGWVLVQGDTTTAMVGAVAAYYRGVRVAHVEAGLRTYDPRAPFPEEINRTFISRVADLHFAPTERAAYNLRREGVPADRIHLTGNTVVDALFWVRDRVRQGMPPGLPSGLLSSLDGRKLILVTGHRRESFGEGLENICLALREIARRCEDSIIVYPVHLNPKVREPVQRILGDEPRVNLIDPLPYEALIYLMDRSYCILTDSGGIQEEAPSLGKPVLVMRNATERPEAVEAGLARLVGTQRENIVRAACELLSDSAAYEQMARRVNPYGDGRASQRIVKLLTEAQDGGHERSGPGVRATVDEKSELWTMGSMRQ